MVEDFFYAELFRVVGLDCFFQGVIDFFKTGGHVLGFGHADIARGYVYRVFAASGVVDDAVAAANGSGVYSYYFHLRKGAKA